MDSTGIDVGIWEGKVTRNVDELSIGTHEFILELEYEDWNSETSIVIVHVMIEPLQLLQSPQIVIPLQPVSIFVTVVSVQVILWAVIVSHKDKKEWNLNQEMIEEENKRDYFAEVFDSLQN